MAEYRYRGAHTLPKIDYHRVKRFPAWAIRAATYTILVAISAGGFWLLKRQKQ